jgi:hypothetical protein
VAGTYYGGQVQYAPPAYSYNGPSVYIQSAPPAPIYEPLPAPRAGFVWSPGYHDWRDGRYVWLSGQWMPARAGYAWRAPEWQRRGDGAWFLAGGSWVQGDNYSYNRAYGDRDRDGIPNYADRNNRPYGDRDRDGVPNYYDRNDRNPYRN